MSRILELTEKRAKAWDAAKAFIGAKSGENGLLSAEDAAQYDRMEADVVAYGREIERLGRQAEIEAELNAPTSDAIRNSPHNPSPDAKTGRASADYERDFFAAMRGRAVTNALTTQVDTDGGYLCPTEFENQIVQGLDEMNVVRPLAKALSTANDREIPMLAAPATAAWTAENAAIDETTLKFKQKILKSYKIATLIRVSNELMNDSMFNLKSFIAAEFARALAVKEEEAFVIGTGVEQPTGIFHATDGADIGYTAAGAAAITFDDIIGLVHSLKTPYRRRAAFLLNDATVAAVRKLKDGNGNFIWQPSPQAGQPDRLFGYSLHMSPFVPALASGALALAFGDLSNYWIADRIGRSVKRLDELYAANDQTGFRATQRVDGKVINKREETQ